MLAGTEEDDTAIEKYYVLCIDMDQPERICPLLLHCQE